VGPDNHQLGNLFFLLQGIKNTVHPFVGSSTTTVLAKKEINRKAADNKNKLLHAVKNANTS
jgi:hypothetical protein